MQEKARDEENWGKTGQKCSGRWQTDGVSHNSQDSALLPLWDKHNVESIQLWREEINRIKKYSKRTLKIPFKLAVVEEVYRFPTNFPLDTFLEKGKYINC